MSSGIYQIFNKVNGKRYIGSAVDLDKRWKVHKTELNRKRHHSRHLQSAWNIYGESAFVFQVIEYVENANQLIYKEQGWLKYTESYKEEYGYNMSPTAGSMFGYKMPEESNQKKSMALKNRKRLPFTEEHKQKLSEAKKGKKVEPFTDEHKHNISQSLKGRIFSIEWRKKLSEAKKGKTPWNKGLKTTPQKDRKK